MSSRRICGIGKPSSIFLISAAFRLSHLRPRALIVSRLSTYREKNMNRPHRVASGVVVSASLFLALAVPAIAERSESVSAGAAASRTAPPVYRVDVVGSGVPRAINGSGQVIGWTGSPTRAFIWTQGTGMRELPNLGAGPSVAYDVNDLGQVVGESAGHAVRWTSGAVKDLGVLEAGGSSTATGINELGHVAGSATVGGQTHAFLFTDADGLVDITPATPVRAVWRINERDQIAGYRSLFSGNRAFRWTSGVLADLGVPADFAHSFGLDINDSGQVSGGVTSATGNSERVARFTDGIGWELLGGLGETNLGYGLNNAGDVVGEGVPVSGPTTGVVFFDGLGLFDLDELVPGTEWNILFAADINDAGQIAALAFNTLTGQSATVRLSPTPSNGGIHVADVTVALELHGRGGSGLATVTVVNESGSGVAGATVTGDWRLNGTTLQTGRTAVTGADGRAHLRSDRVKRVRSGDLLAFCVSNVQHADSRYDQGANTKTCGQAVVP
jgi:probable HAF family extracellular repeat protein